MSAYDIARIGIMSMGGLIILSLAIGVGFGFVKVDDENGLIIFLLMIAGCLFVGAPLLLTQWTP